MLLKKMSIYTSCFRSEPKFGKVDIDEPLVYFEKETMKNKVMKEAQTLRIPMFPSLKSACNV